MPLMTFMAWRFNVASSSDCPPERNTTPGNADTIVRDRVLTVYSAIYLEVALWGQEIPGVTIFGLRSRPSISRCWVNNSRITALNTFSETSAHTSMLWSPSWRISGSIMGTNPLAWQIEPYLANYFAFSSIAAFEGHPSPILRTARHFANLQPNE